MRWMMTAALLFGAISWTQLGNTKKYVIEEREPNAQRFETKGKAISLSCIVRDDVSRGYTVCYVLSEDDRVLPF